MSKPSRRVEESARGRRREVAQAGPQGGEGTGVSLEGTLPDRRSRDSAARRRIDETLRFIAQRGWMGTAENFLAALAQFLGETLDVDYVVIDRLAADPGIAETAALFAKGQIAPSVRYPLKGTPCEQVIGKSLCVYRQGVQSLFPRDQLLTQMGAESYAGIPLWDSTGKPIGLIAVIDGKPLFDEEAVAPMLQLVATRAAAELERERSELLLRKRESEFRSLAEHTPDNIARYSLDARTLYVNPTFEKTLGVRGEQVVGKTPIEAFPQCNAADYESHLREVARTGCELEMELLLPARGEPQRCYSVRFVAECDEAGSPVGVLALGRDITERKRAEREHLAHLRFVENLDRINSALHGSSDLDRMMSDVLDAVLSIFECDRAWLVYPCDPQAATWRAPMERTRPEYPGALALGVEQPVDAHVAQSMRLLLSADGPLKFGPDTEHALPAEVNQRFGVRSFIAMALYPKVGKPWLFGLHQCSHARTWLPEEEKLLKEIGRRLADGLTTLLVYRDLQKSEREFRSLAEHSPDLTSRVDCAGRYLYISPVITRLCGLMPESFVGDLIGETRRRCGHRIDEASVQRLRDAVRRTVDTGQAQACEVFWAQGSVGAFLEYRLAPEFDAAGKIGSVLCIARDVTERKRAEEAQKRLNRSLRLLSSCNQLLIHADDESRLLAAVCRLVVEAGAYLLAWVSVAEQDGEDCVRPIAATAIRTGELQLHQDLLGDPRLAAWKPAMLERGFRSSASLPLKDARATFGALTIFAGEPEAFIPEEVELLQELASNLAYGMRTLRARGEHKVAEEKLAFLAHHDPLTQLPNRVLLRDRFEQALAGAKRGDGQVAMLFLDLDSFKEINDSLGHDIGDQLLICVAERLRACVRATDTVSREGGDEFVVLLTAIAGPEAVVLVVQQILTAMERPFEIAGTPLHTTLSVGVSLFPDDGTDFDTLRRNSDTALFHAKDAGRNAYRFFNEQMNRDAIERLQTQFALRAALKADEFRLHYQPRIRIDDRRVVGMEALLRWQRCDGELVAPGEFIAVAEASGLIIPIGRWVLAEACRQAMAWRAAGLPHLQVAVNLSLVQFRRGNILAAVSTALEQSGLPAESLELELTESILLQDTEAAVSTLHALKAIGVKLALDDFGTGYSSLSYLKRLPLDTLKIDQSFVRQLVQSTEDAAIVRAIIQLGHILQLDVVAEGVETDAQLAFLKENGCDQIQGYLISRAIPPQDFLHRFGPAAGDAGR